MSTLLQKLRAVAATEAKATPGPLKASTDEDATILYVDLPEDEAGPDAISILFQADWGTPEDAALIAESRNLLKAALALVEAQHEALKDIANMPEHDQDDAHRLRNKGKHGAALANQEQP